MTNNDKIRVLVVDDTAFMRKAIPQLLETDPEIQVVDVAKNGLDALEKIRQLKPDVITLDIDMPVMDGLTAIKHIMIESPLPIVVLSSLVTEGAITFEALRLGVADFVPKPSGAISLDIDHSRQNIIDRIKMVHTMKLENVRRVRLPKKWGLKERLENLYHFYPLEYMIAIGTTLAGPNTVIRLLSQLTPMLPAVLVVIQEISPRIISSFADQFNEQVPWRIEVGKDGAVLEQGICYILSNEEACSIRVNEKGAPSLYTDHAARDYPLNQLFSSAADVFRQNTIGILLSGIGDDGSDGLGRIREEFGITMAMNTFCCVFPNLTDNAIQKGVVDMVLDEQELSAAIESVVK
ncbi:MAG: hypothetical protein B6245_14990 [Desulfobacteraceae bacterium 4572_88]|nr:MAG: hypothetical protein B6245_14990 [Desulfobacteraceae bacterium 4572_88]